MAVFSNQYWAVNREERWFCSLFAHSLLASSTTRTKFSELISDTVELGADRFEVYTEVAALRDYWNALGDPQKYTVETHEKRLATLLTLFKFQNLDGSMIESGFIWTSSSRKKLWSP